jgi:hypothetical protein
VCCLTIIHVSFIFLKKPTYLKSPIALKVKILAIIQSPYLESHCGELKVISPDITKMKRPKPNKPNATINVGKILRI